MFDVDGTLMAPRKRAFKERLFNMEDKHSSELIPVAWKFETKVKKDASQVSNFDFTKKKSGPSSESASYQIEESLDSGEETDTEKSLDSEKDNDSDTEKSMDLEKASDTKISLDSQRDTDPGKFPKNDPIENISASLLASLPSISEFVAYPEPMQISSEPASDMEFKNSPRRITHHRRRIKREQALVQITRPRPRPRPCPCLRPRIKVAVPQRNSRILKRSPLCPNPDKAQLLHSEPSII